LHHGGPFPSSCVDLSLFAEPLTADQEGIFESSSSRVLHFFFHPRFPFSQSRGGGLVPFFPLDERVFCSLFPHFTLLHDTEKVTQVFTIFHNFTLLPPFLRADDLVDVVHDVLCLLPMAVASRPPLPLKMTKFLFSFLFPSWWATLHHRLGSPLTPPLVFFSKGNDRGIEVSLPSSPVRLRPVHLLKISSTG